MTILIMMIPNGTCSPNNPDTNNDSFDAITIVLLAGDNEDDANVVNNIPRFKNPTVIIKNNNIMIIIIIIIIPDAAIAKAMLL